MSIAAWSKPLRRSVTRWASRRSPSAWRRRKCSLASPKSASSTRKASTSPCRNRSNLSTASRARALIRSCGWCIRRRDPIHPSARQSIHASSRPEALQYELMTNELSSAARTISVAPMMDYTDRHCRYFLRLLSPSALLYTEMIMAPAIVRGNADRLLRFDAAEHPVALQVGGSDPRELARAARAGEEHGYDEVNLNCGCPSDRVQSGRFGACLMGEPTLVAECVAAMRESVRVQVSVKCRSGAGPMPASSMDEYAFLVRIVETGARAGCTVCISHARRAVLQGLSPKENREIPPLRYDIARRI